MQIKLIVIGKTAEAYLKHGIDEYLGRLKHYVKMEYIEITALKNSGSLSVEQVKEKESELILKSVQSSDHLVLLDEGGKELSSIELSKWIGGKMNTGVKTLVFVVGGAYGFSKNVYGRADMKLSLSRMTFSHQMVRLFFVEQLYRGFTILKGEKYHHQ